MSLELDTVEEVDIEQAIAEVVEPLKELDQQLAQQEVHVLNELEEIRDKRKRLKAMLRQADPTMPMPGRKLPKPESQISISEKTSDRVLACVGSIEEEFDSTVVQAALPDLGKDTVRKALIRLRERGQIRLTGHRRGMGGAKLFLTTPRGREDAATLAKLQEAATNGSEP